MIYGIYKSARNAAWQCLLNFKVDRLPVKVSDIAERAGIIVLKNSDVNVLKEKTKRINDIPRR